MVHPADGAGKSLETKGQWQLALSALRHAEVKRRERDVIGFNAAINVCQLVEFYYIDWL